MGPWVQLVSMEAILPKDGFSMFDGKMEGFVQKPEPYLKEKKLEEEPLVGVHPFKFSF